MLRQDWISGAAFVYCLLAVAWLAIWNTVTVVLFPVILLLMGYVGERRFRKNIGDEGEVGESDNPRKLPFSQIALYSGAALAAILATGYYVSYLPLTEMASLPALDGFLYSTSMAVAEEYFFRGFILDMLLSITIPVGSFKFLGQFVNNNYVKIGFSAVVFMGYHWARYGTAMDSLAYVLVGGFALGLVNYRLKRLSPSIIAHGLNNVIALVGV
jgi:membrane protease YdiL (CAAX protease family)